MDKLPRVGMIWLPDNPVSVKYKEIVDQSWINAGFEIDYFDGVTPENMHKMPPLNFGIKSGGRNAGKPLTDTEKAIWHSHVMMWKIAARKQNPLIVIEHDVMLLRPIESWVLRQYPILGICHVGLLSKKPEKGYRTSAGGAYVITAEIAEKMVRELPKEITYNSDGYLHNYITRYGAFRHEYSTQLYLPKVGATINHDA